MSDFHNCRRFYYASRRIPLNQDIAIQIYMVIWLHIPYAPISFSCQNHKQSLVFLVGDPSLKFLPIHEQDIVAGGRQLTAFILEDIHIAIDIGHIQTDQVDLQVLVAHALELGCSAVEVVHAALYRRSVEHVQLVFVLPEFLQSICQSILVHHSSLRTLCSTEDFFKHGDDLAEEEELDLLLALVDLCGDVLKQRSQGYFVLKNEVFLYLREGQFGVRQDGGFFVAGLPQSIFGKIAETTKGQKEQDRLIYLRDHLRPFLLKPVQDFQNTHQVIVPPADQLDQLFDLPQQFLRLLLLFNRNGPQLRQIIAWRRKIRQQLPNSLEIQSCIWIEGEHLPNQLYPPMGQSWMVDLKPSLLLIVHQETIQLQGSLDALVELLAGQHLIQDVACTEDIAFLVVDLVIALVYLLNVDLRSRVDGCTSFEGSTALLDLPGYPEIGYLQFPTGSQQEIVWFQIPVIQSCIGSYLRLSFIQAIPYTNCLKSSYAFISVIFVAIKLPSVPPSHSSRNMKIPSGEFLSPEDPQYSMILGCCNCFIIVISFSSPCGNPKRFIREICLTAMNRFRSLSYPLQTLPKAPPPSRRKRLQKKRGVICVQPVRSRSIQVQVISTRKITGGEGVRYRMIGDVGYHGHSDSWMSLMQSSTSSLVFLCLFRSTSPELIRWSNISIGFFFSFSFKTTV